MSLTKLKKLKEESLERFTLEGLKTKAKVVYIHDGDTLDLGFYRNEELLRFNCRLKDVGAPELREENGKLVRDFLAWICMGEDPDEFDENAEIWSKHELQDELESSKNLVYAVFGEFDECGMALVTLKKSSHASWKTINDMVSAYVKKLENMSDSSTSSDFSDTSESSSLANRLTSDSHNKYASHNRMDVFALIFILILTIVINHYWKASIVVTNW